MKRVVYLTFFLRIRFIICGLNVGYGLYTNVFNQDIKKTEAKTKLQYINLTDENVTNQFVNPKRHNELPRFDTSET